ncbi:A/G-specific adenine glycosylase [Kangiella sediminilitoris]|uniref:Adenine DNA glycosylase n=1 Tax=Kangiella sediminilitoris TaxID=1144748 RepID=A0A1B3BDI4_9GAMM|nr:A/G-specific adenine glycosylase [Kangiella sediminilitoris]AOE50889.1 adenine DNA glycosylase [Kangiella sediminilitoris]
MWQPKDFQHKVIEYYRKHGRKHLPWQGTKDAYRIWLSEIMLQQTQVSTVIPYYENFLQRFPTIVDLAKASEDEVMHLWSGLGYYSRARNLHKAAKKVADEFNGDFPKTQEEIEALPGVGRSTAGAVAAFAFDQSTAILDGNVKRVLARCYGIEGWAGKASVLNSLWQRAEANTPDTHTAQYNQAMMDLGAVVCTRTKPKCDTCPLSDKCYALKHDMISALPGKKPKKARPKRAVYWLVCLQNDQVVLHKRPPSGIWGGLWCFPEIEQSQSEPEHQQKLDSFLHKFSHYDLEVQPLLVKNIADTGIMEPNQIDTFALNEIAEIGLPTPVSKLLQTLAEN